MFTVSAYGCVPAPGGQLCPAGDARVGARSVLDCNTGLICGASCTQPHERSADFETTVKHGMRTVRSDMVVYWWRGSGGGPRVGLIIAKSVGSAVERHRVARRLRHVAGSIVKELHPSDHVVIRALPSSRHVSSARLEQQLRCGLRRAVELAGSDR